MQLLDACAVNTFDENLDGTVGKFQKLKNGCNGTDAVQVVRFRVVNIRLLLRDQHDSLVGAHGNVQRLYRLLTADEKRDHHVRINDYIPERQYRHVLDASQCWSGSSWFGHAQALDNRRDTAAAASRGRWC